MKRLLAVALALMIASLMPMSAYATEEHAVNQDGPVISSEAEWWERFNSLTPDQQARINFRPNRGSRESIEALPQETTARLEETHALYAANLLPVGGGEPVYNYSYWEEHKEYANCYIYAMDVIASTYGGADPGSYGGGQVTQETLTKSNVASLIYTAIKNDGPYLGNGRGIRTATKSEKPGSNEYKIAIVVDPGWDYHFYVQNSDGYWSHKPGIDSCTRKDASGNSITDPGTADHDYGYANYEKFCGYYIITRK